VVLTKCELGSHFHSLQSSLHHVHCLCPCQYQCLVTLITLRWDCFIRVKVVLLNVCFMSQNFCHCCKNKFIMLWEKVFLFHKCQTTLVITFELPVVLHPTFPLPANSIVSCFYLSILYRLPSDSQAAILFCFEYIILVRQILCPRLWSFQQEFSISCNNCKHVTKSNGKSRGHDVTGNIALCDA